MRRDMHRQLSLLLILAIAGCARPPAKVTRTEVQMGTLVSISVFAVDRRTADAALEAALAEIQRLDALLSRDGDQSEVARLNRDKQIQDPSAALRVNIERSIEYGALTRGAFDITVLPVLDLYERSFEAGETGPTAEQIDEVRRRVDYRRITISEADIRLGQDQAITLGGIAKGYAVDRAIDVLAARGIRHALVDAGGDLRTLGAKPGDRKWIIAVRDPQRRDQTVTRIAVSDLAVVTSGDYERYFDEQRNYHHIVSPLTGYSPKGLISVTVVTGSAFDADAISTAVFVLGQLAGMQLVESRTGVEALLITSDGTLIRSSGFADYEQLP